MNLRTYLAWMTVITMLLCGGPLHADEDAVEDADKVYPVAILPFLERGDEVKEMGGKVTDLLFVNLVAKPDLFLVDREDLGKLIEEQELNLSGLVNPSQAMQVGQLTGAKILVTGSVLQVGENLYIVAKIMGTETSRVVGQSVKGDFDDELDELVESLSEAVGRTIARRAKELVAKPVTHADRLAKLKDTLKKGRRPTIAIDITEQHVGQASMDPAAETELALFCSELGFQVLDSAANKKDMDVLLVGEGFSEFASRHGNLVSVKARLEVKALDRKTGQVLAIDRQTSVAVDLAEQIAAKAALQESAARIAERLLPKIAASKK